MFPPFVQITGTTHEKHLATSRFEPCSLTFSPLSILQLTDRILQIRPDLFRFVESLVVPHLIDGTQPTIDELIDAHSRSEMVAAIHGGASDAESAPHQCPNLTWDNRYIFASGTCEEVKNGVLIEGDWPITVSLLSRVRKTFALTVSLPTHNRIPYDPSVSKVPLAWQYLDSLSSSVGLPPLSITVNQREVELGPPLSNLSNATLLVQPGIKLELSGKDRLLAPTPLFGSVPLANRGGQLMASFPYHTPVEVMVKNQSYPNQRRLLDSISPQLAEVLCNTGLLRYARSSLTPEPREQDERRQVIAKSLYQLIGSSVSELVLKKVYQPSAKQLKGEDGSLAFLNEPYTEATEIVVGAGIPSPMPAQLTPSLPIISETLVRTPFGDVLLANFVESGELSDPFQEAGQHTQYEDSTILSLFPLNSKLVRDHCEDLSHTDRKSRSEELSDFAWKVTHNALSSQEINLNRDTFLEMLACERTATGYPRAHETSFILRYANGLYVRFAPALM